MLLKIKEQLYVYNNWEFNLIHKEIIEYLITKFPESKHTNKS